MRSMNQGFKHLGPEIESLASRTSSAALQLRFAKNHILDGSINCDGDVHFLLFFWFVGFALVDLEFDVCGTNSF